VVNLNRHGVVSLDWRKVVTLNRQRVVNITGTSMLRKHGIEVDCREKNFDPNIPEDLLIQAIHLAIPEVENIRRSKNTKEGIRRALEEGRFPQKAPRGYENYREHGRAYIRPSRQKDIVIEALMLFASGNYGREELRQLMSKKGLVFNSKTSWRSFLQNPIYAGLIVVPFDPITGEAERMVVGVHEPLISIETRELIILRLKDTGRKNPEKKNTFSPLFPLRKNLLCSECGNKLTGSSSKGSRKQYQYYHCRSGCSFGRLPTHEAHNLVLNVFKSFQVKKNVIKEYQSIVAKEFKKKDADRTNQIKSFRNQISTIENEIHNLDELLVESKLSAINHDRIVSKLDKKLIDLKEALEAIENTSSNHEEYLKTGISLIENLPYYFKYASPQLQARIVSSIFPDKLILYKKECRTPRVNEVIRLIWDLEGDKSKKTSLINSDLSCSVDHHIYKSNFLYNDLALFQQFNPINFK
jgi:site-specific DNA recombinase